MIISKNLANWGRTQDKTAHELEASVQSILDIISKIAPKVRTQQVLDAIDITNEKSEMASKASCVSGCSSCCHQPIMLSDEEAEHIIAFIKSKNIEIDLEKLKEQAKWEKEDYYKNENSKKTGCVFLNDNYKCSIYSHRPAACRSYFVVSHPTFCRLKYRHSHQQFAIAINSKAEMIISALWSLSKGKIEPLAKKVHNILKA